MYVGLQFTQERVICLLASQPHPKYIAYHNGQISELVVNPSLNCATTVWYFYFWAERFLSFWNLDTYTVKVNSAVKYVLY